MTTTVEVNSWDMLVRRTSKGAIQTWLVSVEPETDGTATIVTRYGLLDGAIQETRDNIAKGKNIGRKNATTPYTQAVAEAQSLWNEKRDRNCYGLTIEESDLKKQYAPMLAQSWFNKKRQMTGYAKKVDWADVGYNFGQPKFDGNRCAALIKNGRTILKTREGVEIDSCDHLTDIFDQANLPDVSLDGELYIHGMRVTEIRGLIAKKQPGTENLCFVMYDLNDPYNPFPERFKSVIEYKSRLGGNVHLSRTVPINSEAELLAFHDECVQNGYEGAMLRHGRDGYAAGDRDGQLLKVKDFTDAEFKIIDCKGGRGKFKDAAVFVCITDAGHEFDVTAPGSIKNKEEYLANKEQYIGRNITVKFQMFTDTAKPVPFQPVAKDHI